MNEDAHKNQNQFNTNESSVNNFSSIPKQETENSIKTRKLISLSIIILYAVISIIMIPVALFGIIFTEGFHNENTKELIGYLYGSTFLSLLIAILILFVTLFFYRTYLRWFLILTTITPIVLITTFIFVFLKTIKEEIKYTTTRREQIIRYNTAVIPVLESIESIIPSIKDKQCKSNSTSEYGNACISPSLFKEDNKPLTSEELSILETELKKLWEVKNKYPIESKYFTSAHGIDEIHVNITSGTSTKNLSCEDLQNGLGDSFRYDCWVSQKVTCEETIVHVYEGVINNKCHQ